MAKRAYVGVDGTARKVKKLYAGVGGTARKVKKGYVGVNGTARPCWTGGELTYFGSSEDGAIERPRPSLCECTKCSVSFNNHAIFAGGVRSKDSYGTIYNENLSATTFSFNRAKNGSGAATVGDYALFAGGIDETRDDAWKGLFRAEPLDKNMLLITEISFYYGAFYMGVASTEKYALFAGGTSNTSYPASTMARVNCFDQELVSDYLSPLPSSRYYVSGITLEDKMLFAGGTNHKEVTVYDNSLVQIAAADLSQAYYGVTAAKVGTYALFGPKEGGQYSMTLDVYDSNLVKLSDIKLSEAKIYMGSGSVNNFAIFIGGLTTETRYLKTLDTYDDSLCRIAVGPSLIGSEQMLSANTGEYIIFGCGTGENNNLATTLVLKSD